MSLSVIQMTGKDAAKALEPDVLFPGVKHTDKVNVYPGHTALSQAVSSKRIADSLEVIAQLMGTETNATGRASSTWKPRGHTFEEVGVVKRPAGSTMPEPAHRDMVAAHVQGIMDEIVYAINDSENLLSAKATVDKGFTLDIDKFNRIKVEIGGCVYTVSVFVPHSYTPEEIDR